MSETYDKMIKDLSKQYEAEKYLNECSVNYYKDTDICSDCGSLDVEFDYEIKYEKGGSKVEEYYCLDCKSTDELISYSSCMDSLSVHINEVLKNDEFGRIRFNGLVTDRCYKDNINQQNKTLNKAYSIIENRREYKATEDQANQLKASIVFVFEELEEKQKKVCSSKCENLDYIEDIICGEVEHWGCKSCSRGYNIPIEIVRDFKEKELIED